MQAKFQKVSWLIGGAALGVLLTAGVSTFASKEAPTALPINELRAFTEVFGRIKQDYVEPVEDKKLINEAINGMLTGLDPHSAYLDADAYKELRVATTGEFGGLGLEVNMQDGLVRVVAPIDDTPAAKAGVRAGDYIMKIDDTPVRGMSLSDAVAKMRGKPNSPVTLTILRKGEGQPLTFKLTRAIIKVQSVKSTMLEPGFGYVRLSQFQERSTEDLARALLQLYKENKGDLQGLVLDLRNDPGGVLSAAVGVSSLFLPEDKLVVYTEGRAADSRIRLKSSHEALGKEAQALLKSLGDQVKRVPLVVLVNGGSASASEIVAGALQDYKRAVVVGTQTFGKGSVQTVLPITRDTAIKLTTARYFTPNGRSIQAKGIVPDIEVEDPAIGGVNLDAFRVREADLERHLNNPQGGEERTSNKAEAVPAGEARRKPSRASAPQDEDDILRPGEISVRKDAQLKQALTVLKVQQVISPVAKHPAS
jgi:carboxyl-terminal processing protease